MASSDDIPVVCFLDDVARVLRTSRRTIEKARRARTFPIPEIKGIDKRPRWSGAAVRKFIETGATGRQLLKLVG